VLDPLKNLLVTVLDAAYGLAGDYGVAIILLTIVIRLMLMPLTIKQTRSMYELQRIQPKIKQLQEKYKNDKQKLQEETLKFYQENKVNPFGGCLPMILQMPIFIALFQVLNDEKGLGNFWIVLPDLTKSAGSVFGESGLLSALPYAIFVVLFGLSVWIPILVQPGEKQQKQIGMYMAVMMLFFGWTAPAGVVLYWVTSSFLGVGQTLTQMRIYKRQEEPA
jgi:YidC/Oxa1 family membrane protein insertase